MEISKREDTLPWPPYTSSSHPVMHFKATKWEWTTWNENENEDKNRSRRQFDTQRSLDRTSSVTVVAGSTITFHHLHYTVKVQPPGRRCGSNCPKEILHDISGIFSPGMNAILGPTGGGKTTLLDVLAGRKGSVGLQGHVLVDGKRQPKNFKSMAGYVVQDDVLMGTLTVRENIMFSANLRLSSSVSTKEKEVKVEETIQELGLSKCANSKIGNEYIRGISGGERKRTSIGIELIISPDILFLDEPTTGLDASTAYAVISLLSRLSKQGRTIIFSIHQPRYSIYSLFDRLVLLGGGLTIYHGPAQEALDFFSQIGYKCEQHNNPPDFYLDVINGQVGAVPKSFQLTLSSEVHVVLEDLNSSVGRNEQLESNNDGDNSLSHRLNKQYINSSWYKSVCNEIDPIKVAFEKADKRGIGDHPYRGEYATGFFTQLKYVSRRSLLNIFRNPQSCLLYIVASLFMAGVDTAIYFQLGNDEETAVQNRVGAFFFILITQVFGSLPALELFIKERCIFLRETASGFYRVSAYFFCKIFFDLIPMRIIPLTCLSCIVYFTIGFQRVVGKFFIFYFDLFLTTMAASAIAFAYGASIPVFTIANVLTALTYIVMMVVGGILVNLKTLATWISWTQYLSIFRYSLNALSINELTDIIVYETTPNSTVKIAISDAGTQYMNQEGIAYETAWDLWQNMMALAIITIAILFVAYAQLRRIRSFNFY